jgi:hypothetical protein
MYAAIFCNGDRKQAGGLLLPKRSTHTPDYFMLHLVRPHPHPPPLWATRGKPDLAAPWPTPNPVPSPPTNPFNQHAQPGRAPFGGVTMSGVCASFCMQGYKLGVAATLAFWVLWDCVVQVAKFGKPTIVVKAAFPVYRGEPPTLPRQSTTAVHPLHLRRRAEGNESM